MGLFNDIWRRMMTSKSPRVHELINKTHSVGGFPIEVPKTMRDQGTSRFVRPYTDMSVQEYDEMVAYLVTSPDLTEQQKTEELKRLSKISPHKHKIPNLGPLNNAAEIKYDPNPTTGFFDTRKFNPDLQSFISLDIETDDYKQPISIAALKLQFNPATGKFEHVDTFQRFYSTKWQNIRTTHATHGLSPAELRSLRRQQGADYSKVYNASEMEAMYQFIGDSIIMGQNVVPFDLPALFHGRAIPNSTLDTMFAGRNVWQGMKNDLDTIFQRMFGKTMEQAGLHHHMAHADTIAVAMIMQEMAKWEGVTGKSIQYVMKHPQGFHLAQIDSYLPEAEQVIRGTYLAAMRGEIGAYMKAQDLGLTDAQGNLLPGIHYDRPSSSAPGSDVDSVVMEAVKDLLKVQKERSAEASGTVGDLMEAYHDFSNWRRSDLIQKLTKTSFTEGIELLRSAGYETGSTEAGNIISMARKLRSVREAEDAELANWRATARDYNEEGMSFDRDDAFRKIRYLNKLERKGSIFKGQRVELDNLIGSFDDLKDATEGVIEKNQRLLSVYAAFANIKPYDINQYVGSAKQQWSGVMSAANGVVPNFLLNPISRIGSASFNYWEGKLAPWNAFNRTWNSTAGQVGNAAMGIGIATGNPIALGVGGVLGAIGAGTQIYGNYKQQQMETAMLGVQNTLNSLGAMINWIATPFRLLHRVVKMLIGSFSGLTVGINNFMKNGIGAMSQMGNPLSELTGVNYAAYEGTTMMDIASLFNKGSMNSVYENFAKQQKAFYTLGQVNTNRLIASSLLGVYGDVYNPSTDTEGQYNTMVNKLLAAMQGQSDEQKQRTMYLASEIDSNLPSLLRTANMLGVTDINQLTDPTRRGIYWRPLSDEQERQYRWTQYEYGAAQQQWGHSKMKISNWLWQSFGKNIYNGINGIVDQLSEGNWHGALDQAKQMWAKFKEQVSTIWKDIKGVIEGDEKSGTTGWGKTFKLLGLQITNIALQVAKVIVSIWDDVMLRLIDKAEGLMAYLSTVSITPHYDWKTKELTFDVNSISTAKAGDADKQLYQTYNYQGHTYRASDNPNEGMAGYVALADAIYGKGRSDIYGSKTGTQVMADAIDYLRAGNALDLSDYGYYVPAFENGIKLQDYQDLQSLFAAIGKAGLKDKQSWRVAAWMEANVPQSWKIANFDDTTGYYKFAEGMVKGTEDVLRNTIDILQGEVNNEIKLIIEAKDSTGKTTRVPLTGEDGKSVVARDILHLRNMVAEGYNLVVQKGNGG